MEDYILQMEHITKLFPGVRALDDVNFSVRRGEIHALVGENGAGKSTLMKVLSGIYPAGTYEGKLIYNGVQQAFQKTRDSEKQGIVIIYQELNLIKTMTLCENIFLGNEIRKNGVIQWQEQYKKCEALFRRVHLEESADTKIGDIGVGKQQLVEIAKALNKDAKLIILDEPTASLTESEVGVLMEILRELKSEQATCIYISHKLGEVFEIADRVTVLRDGRTILTRDVAEMTEDSLIAAMVGRELIERFPRRPHTAGETVLEAKNWTALDPKDSTRELVRHVEFRVRRGEILGIAGLMGAGRTELAMSLFGALPAAPESELFLEGKKVRVRSPREAIEHGIGYVSEDRKRYGLVLENGVMFNMSLASLDKLTRFHVIDRNREIKQTQRQIDALHTKVSSIDVQAKNLSGGNQQKVILSKWMLTQPKILIVDEPTRGIDVGAKYEIYQIMNELVEQGVCIVMISSELPEILGMSDRIYVLHEGKINAELDWREATQEKILYYAAGGEQSHESESAAAKPEE
ncbi:xylose ABC transporter ATP-binding protein [Agathobaculum sp.]|uniref:xylose ABC transporter ATP-binding protein n=1 Tax=Agathobaculum sp. TaxID=2048138 RepID=UPI002A8072C1|nr:xylose ABC transporter ATP-binding protein [Agathobaculum sp.]MDY3618407.1 xylose ABC transporter ATP-binding protein [Agathobaculum sp.]